MNRRISALAAIMATFALFVALLGNIFSNPRQSYADEVQKEIFLTFDDGPSDRVTPKVLDILKSEKVPATFFVVGSCIESRRELLKRIYDEGHTIAVHSYSHNYKEIYKSPKALIEDIEKCNDIICSVTGEFAWLYRFPGGSYNLSDKLICAVKSRGYVYVDWNASFCDSEIMDATSWKLYNAAISSVRNSKRIVMLAHDSTDKTATAEALRDVIHHFKDKGYKFKKF